MRKTAVGQLGPNNSGRCGNRDGGIEGWRFALTADSAAGAKWGRNETVVRKGIDGGELLLVRGLAIQEPKQCPKTCGTGLFGARAGFAYSVVPLVLRSETTSKIIDDDVVCEVSPGLGDSGAKVLL